MSQVETGGEARHNGAQGASRAATPVTGERARFWILIIFLLFCALGGGASRTDVLSLIYLRPAAVLCIFGLLAVRGPWHFRELRALFILLGTMAALVALQLVPLPPGMWQMLPGRAPYAEAAAALGIAQPWRPLTLTPDLTIASLLDFLPPFAVLFGLAGIPGSRRQALLPFMLCLICASAVLGILQLNSPADSPVFLYQIRHEGSAVGLFANRNHQAALIAIAFPLLRLWTLTPASGASHARNRFWVAIGIALLLLPMVLVVGSRAGMGLAALGIVAAALMAPSRGDLLQGLTVRARRFVKLAGLATPLSLLVLAVALGRAVSVQRLFLLENADNEVRLANAPLTLRIARDFFPFGAGFGSFDPVFRTYEPDQALSPLYFNHAHNDLVELVISGGLPALLGLLAFMLWWLWRGWSAFVPYRAPSVSALFARAGVIATLILLLASLVDYPLRTPLLGVVFVIACAWISRGPMRQNGLKTAIRPPLAF